MLGCMTTVLKKAWEGNLAEQLNVAHLQVRRPACRYADKPRGVVLCWSTVFAVYLPVYTL